jgi:hypothetical protein
MKKLTYLLTALIGLLSVTTLQAQQAKQADSVSDHNWFRRDIAGAVQLQFTYRRSDIGELNQTLADNGLKPITANDYWINASMHHSWQNWITEDGIGFAPEQGSANNGLYAKYSQYQAFFTAGYNILHSKQMKLYPLLGINFSASVLNIEDNNSIRSTNSFSSEILNTSATKTFYEPNFGIELGAGFDYLIKVQPKRMDCLTINRNIPVGVRAGYYLNTYAGDWHINNYSLSGDNQKQSNVFVTFTIGLGYEINKP